MATDWSGVVGRSHVYDTTPGELLSVELSNDESNYCGGRAARAFYGEYFESCTHSALYPRISDGTWIPDSCATYSSSAIGAKTPDTDEKP